MPRHNKFLVIDDNADSRFLLVKTLLRKFPQSVIHECQDAEAAVLVVRTTPDLDAIVTHRAIEVDGLTLVQLLRRVNPLVPIVMVSGVDRSREAAAAGATRFLNYDAWLRIGTVVAESMSQRPPDVVGPNGDRPTAASSAPAEPAH